MAGGTPSNGTSENGGDPGRSSRPWWKRPSPWWYLCLVPLSSIADNATIGPRVEILTMLACNRLKPEYTTLVPPGFNGPLYPARTPDTLSVNTDSSHGNLSSLILNTTPNQVAITLPDPAKCKADLDVQREVTKLTTAMTITLGVLGVITVGWWGSLSDRIGRTHVVGINVLGALVMDLAFIAVTLFSKLLPGGYWFVMIGPVVEGCVGGFGAAEATVIAYISDTTKSGERTRFFSLNLGMVFMGMALGPAIGSFLRHATGSPLAAFYLSTTCHALFSLANWTIVPESLSSEHREQTRRERNTTPRSSRGLRATATRGLRSITSFAEPLAVMLPRRRKGQRYGRKDSRFDWSLTLIGFSHMFSLMLMGADPYIIQYAQATYSWTSEQVGYMLSSVGVARAVFLTLVLPLLLRWFKPKEAAIQLPDEQESGQGPSSPSSGSMEADLSVARLSQLAGFVAYPAMSFAPSGILFTVAGSAAALSTGVRPALQSIALAVYSSQGGKESGRLFGALTVLQALGTSVFGPGLLGFAYWHTVGWLSQALFFVAAGTSAIGFLLLQFVRLPDQDDTRDGEESVDDEENEIRASSPREEMLIDAASIDGGTQPGKHTVAAQE